MTAKAEHGGTIESAKARLDESVWTLLEGVEAADPKKSWDGDTMSFSFTGKVGFISVPLAGTAAVDATDVTVTMDLPPMVKNFVGEEKVRSVIEQRLREVYRG